MQNWHSLAERERRGEGLQGRESGDGPGENHRLPSRPALVLRRVDVARLRGGFARKRAGTGMTADVPALHREVATCIRTLGIGILPAPAWSRSCPCFRDRFIIEESA